MKTVYLTAGIAFGLVLGVFLALTATTALPSAKLVDIVTPAIGPLVGAIIALGTSSLVTAFQLGHDRRERREERRIALLRDVYLKALEAVGAEFRAITQFVINPTSDPAAISGDLKAAQGIDPYFPKILLCGSLDAIKAFIKLQGFLRRLLGYGTTRLVARALRAQLVPDPEQKVTELKARLNETEDQSERSALETALKAASHDSYQRSLEMVEAFQATLKESIEKIVPDYDRHLADAIKAARRDLGLQLQEEDATIELIRADDARAVSDLKPLVDLFDRIIGVVKPKPSSPDSKEKQGGSETPT